MPVSSYRASEEYMDLDHTDFICPDGYHIHTVSTFVALSKTKKPIDTLLLYCFPCTEGSYSLVDSHIIMHNLNMTYVRNSTCLSCPYGAICDSTVVAKANFWGDKYEDEISMYLCPAGRLCGQCKDGYSESLYSAKCILNEECTYASIFWIMLGLYGFIYVTFM